MLNQADLNDEAGRVAALQRANILDTAPEESFDKITGLIRSVLGVPIAVVSLVDTDRQWFKSIQGIEDRETPRSISFCTHTIQQRTPFIIEDARADSRFVGSPLVTGQPHIRAYAGVPLRSAEGYNLGALCAIDTEPRSFQESEINLLSNFAALVIDEMELRTMACRDHLTGALTRRAFTEQATAEIERFRRHKTPVSVVMFDLDHFKRLNDTWGHGFGDEVLARTAGAVMEALRPSDLIARYGGEEFALLLPLSDEVHALQCAERIRASISDLKFSQEAHVTASFGVSTTTTPLDTLASLLGQADAALYLAKESGRNRCKSASNLLPPMQLAIGL